MVQCWNMLNVAISMLDELLLSYLKRRTKYYERLLILEIFIVTDFIFALKPPRRKVSLRYNSFCLQF